MGGGAKRHSLPSSAARSTSANKAATPTTRARDVDAGRESGIKAAAPNHVNGNHAAQADVEQQKRINELNEELAAVQQRETEVTQERDFYFSKLRDIELMCQCDGMKERWPIMQAVENILYATTEDEGATARVQALDEFQPSENSMY
eukprot:TRINITY_DN81016_c0_g1_i1.p1 TRINITY_DN81016_c0_g1~~TRINITY_DN81016_c0_g1_i1.p1  ORF type:complete len:147 (+),score=15.98 TRINITY_DN81016_c0_g1_i1:3-443(+)